MLCSAEYFGFFFQAEDGIRDLVRSRGLGDVYKRQAYSVSGGSGSDDWLALSAGGSGSGGWLALSTGGLTLIHI